MPDRFDLSRRKLLGTVGVLGTAGAIGGAGSMAFFSDEEEFANNQLTAGSLDMKVAYDAYYSDWMSDEDGVPEDEGVSVRMYDGAPGTTGGPGDLNAGETGLPTNAAWLVAVDDPDQFLANTQYADQGTATCPDGTDAQDLTQPVIELEDVKPGDFGEVTFDFAICDNPGFVWLNADLQSAAEAGLTDPEAGDDQEDGDADSTDPADVELLDVVQVAVWVDDGDNYQDGGEEPIVVDSLRNVLDAFPASGRPADAAMGNAGLVGNIPAEQGGGMGRNCFSAESTHSVAFAWWVPVDHGNEIQTDSATFSLGLYAEQCRHNEGAGAAEPSGVTMPDGWAFTGQTEPSGLENSGDDPRYGTSVDVGNEVTVVGAPNEDHETDAGSVYVVDGIFEELSPGDEVPDVADGRFGQAVAYNQSVGGFGVFDTAQFDDESLELLAAGAPGDGAGKVYVFTRGSTAAGSPTATSDGEWELATVLDGADFGFSGGDRFGAAVDVGPSPLGPFGVLVGAPGADDETGGAVLVGLGPEGSGENGPAVAQEDGLVPADEALLIQPDPVAGGKFGTSVALDLLGFDDPEGGFAVLVGAPGATVDGTPDVGAVYDFLGPETSRKLVPSDGESGDAYGHDVDVYIGETPSVVVTPVVGAPGADDGAVYVHDRQAGPGSPLEAMGDGGQVGAAQATIDEVDEEEAKLTADGGRFGASVAVFRTLPSPPAEVGDLCVVGGAPDDGPTGTASLFQAPLLSSSPFEPPTLGEFSLLGEFTPGTGTGAEEFGASVAYNSVAGYGGGGPIRIGNLAVGAPGTNVDQGSAYGFDLLANGDGEA